ncbi:DUF1080 domain-containing protein [Maribellus luteus]|uniref:DUF1080 domain-containing protein n=1 Tax=Maribellus luteus TaxID=2305463 RepID=A0A399SP63_9BACT|nr:DUF1080 domain-containing protein [Maribellus luteus]RIJ45480.1 DUF1080 domain-containing protein [Maribellus luteus]
MKIYLIPVLFSLFLVACSSGKKADPKEASKDYPQEIPEGSTALFDGKTLEGWEVTNFGTQGPVKVSEGKIVINMGDGCSGINWLNEFPVVNYEVELEARKTLGNDFFCGLTFPVNEQFCSLIVGGWGGPVVGLSTVDGADASDNETKVLQKFEPNVWYKINLQVNDSTIVAQINGETLVDFFYPGHELGIRPEVSLSRPLGISTWMTTSEIRNVWFRVLPRK